LTAGKRQANQPSSLGVDSNILCQPETRPISQKQLVAEVKGIYAGLVMVEGKCIQVDPKQAVNPTKISLTLNTYNFLIKVAINLLFVLYNK
jgi:hypothetical protein